MLTMQFCKSIHLIEVVQKSVYYLGSCSLKNSLISKYIPNAEWHNFEVLKRKALSICWGYTMMIWKLVQISGHSASFSYFWQSPSSTSHQQPLVSWKFGSLVLLFKTGSYLSQSLTYMCVCVYIGMIFMILPTKTILIFLVVYLDDMNLNLDLDLRGPKSKSFAWIT